MPKLSFLMSCSENGLLSIPPLKLFVSRAADALAEAVASVSQPQTQSLVSLPLAEAKSKSYGACAVILDISEWLISKLSPETLCAPVDLINQVHLMLGIQRQLHNLPMNARTPPVAECRNCGYAVGAGYREDPAESREEECSSRTRGSDGNITPQSRPMESVSDTCSR